jgi:hypothetical protein
LACLAAREGVIVGADIRDPTLPQGPPQSRFGRRRPAEQGRRVEPVADGRAQRPPQRQVSAPTHRGIGTCGAPRIRLRRLTGAGDVWFGESVIEYADGKVVHGVAVIEFRDGKMWRVTHYHAEPFEAPAWRSRWVERIEEPVG